MGDVLVPWHTQVLRRFCSSGYTLVLRYAQEEWLKGNPRPAVRRGPHTGTVRRVGAGKDKDKARGKSGNVAIGQQLPFPVPRRHPVGRRHSGTDVDLVCLWVIRRNQETREVMGLGASKGDART